MSSLAPGAARWRKDALGAAARLRLCPAGALRRNIAGLGRKNPAARRSADCHHHHDLSTLPDDAPLLIIANEFFRRAADPSTGCARPMAGSNG